MREKIEQFARGEVDHIKPEVLLPNQPVIWKVFQGQVLQTQLKFGTVQNERLKGYVLSSDGNLQIKNSRFFAKDVNLQITYDTRNLKAGDKKRGKLILITNGGEFQISFQVHILAKSLETGDRIS